MARNKIALIGSGMIGGTLAHLAGLKEYVEFLAEWGNIQPFCADPIRVVVAAQVTLARIANEGDHASGFAPPDHSVDDLERAVDIRAG